MPTTEERERHNKNMSRFVFGAPFALRHMLLKTHIISLSSESITRHLVNLVEMKHTKGLIVKYRDTNTIHGHIASKTGGGDGWIVSWLIQHIDDLVDKELVLKGDGENSSSENDERGKISKTTRNDSGPLEKAVVHFICQFWTYQDRAGKKVLNDSGDILASNCLDC